MPRPKRRAAPRSPRHARRCRSGAAGWRGCRGTGARRRLVQAELERRRLGSFTGHALRAIDWWGPSLRGAGRLALLTARRTAVGRLVVRLAAMTALCALLTTALVAIIVTQ